MFSENRVKNRKRYRKFILLETPEEINQILGRRKWPSAMGSAGFADWVKKKLFKPTLARHYLNIALSL